MENTLQLGNLLKEGTYPEEYTGGKNWTILHGDTLKLVKAFQPGIFDAVITDPPYASGGTKQNGRMFKLYMYTAIAPIPISTFAGEPSQSVGKNFIKSYAGVCLEGAIIALACIIFSVYAASPPAVGDTSLSAVTIVWNYVGELVFNLLVLVGAVKASDRIVKEMMGL